METSGVLDVLTMVVVARSMVNKGYDGAGFGLL
jgi:hypothetical protein